MPHPEFRRSHSPPILHLNRWLPKSSREELHVHVDGKRSCRGAFTLILSQWWTLDWKTNILDMKFELLKKLQTPVPEHEWSLSLSDVKKCVCVCVWFDFPPLQYAVCIFEQNENNEPRNVPNKFQPCHLQIISIIIIVFYSFTLPPFQFAVHFFFQLPLICIFL